MYIYKLKYYCATHSYPNTHNLPTNLNNVMDYLYFNIPLMVFPI